MKRFLLTLLLALSFGIGAAWAESFTIEFQTRVDNMEVKQFPVLQNLQTLLLLVPSFCLLFQPVLV